MTESWSHRTWVQILPPPRPGGVTLSRAVGDHEPLIPHLEQEQTLEHVSPKHSGCKIIQTSAKSYSGYVIVIPILQMRKLRAGSKPREV